MRLKSVIFYQGVKLWDGNLYQTVQEGINRKIEDVQISIKDHLVMLTCRLSDEMIIVGTSNMRSAVVSNPVVALTFMDANRDPIQRIESSDPISQDNLKNESINSKKKPSKKKD